MSSSKVFQNFADVILLSAFLSSAFLALYESSGVHQSCIIDITVLLKTLKRNIYIEIRITINGDMQFHR